MKDQLFAGILGLAIGDAVGVPVEFVQPHILENDPVTDMRGGGSHEQPMGTWSDDTSMTLALLDALCESSDIPDYYKIMSNFLAWLDERKYTSGDVLFDIGKTCLKSIANFARGEDPLMCGQMGEYDCGNGALMRILPMAFWCRRKYGPDYIDNEEAREVIHNVTSLTHGYSRCLIASGVYLSVAAELLKGKEKAAAVKDGVNKAKRVYGERPEYTEQFPHFKRIFDEKFSKSDRSMIKSSGYVIDTLEAALWAFETSSSYKECILKSVNLGHDTDTTAAVSGGLAGIYYGIDGIPSDWKEKLLRYDTVQQLCEKLSDKLSLLK